MTPQEYIQLKAFARQDGILLSLLWIGALICYVQGLTNPMLSLLAMLLIVASPFLAASRLRHFRDYGREGIISFARGFAYTILIFFYGGVLFAIAIYVYFAYMDNGYLIGKIMETFSTPEGRQALQAYGFEGQLDENLKFLAEMRPIDIAVNMLTINILTGCFVGVPIAALLQRQAAKS